MQKQLTLLSRANITTMHSFCLDVIKNNYHTIDLDPTFRISDETENTLLKLEVINDMFEDYYEEEDIEFRNLIEAYSDSKDDQRLKDIVLDLYKFSMSGPWPKKWLYENAEKFNINSIEELNNSIWVNILRTNMKIEVEGFIKTLEKSITIIRDTEGLEPYEETFMEDLEMFKELYYSLDKGLDEIYKTVLNVKFGRLKVVKKDKVSDVNSQNLVKGIRDDIKKNI